MIVFSLLTKQHVLTRSDWNCLKEKPLYLSFVVCLSLWLVSVWERTICGLRNKRDASLCPRSAPSTALWLSREITVTGTNTPIKLRANSKHFSSDSLKYRQEVQDIPTCFTIFTFCSSFLSRIIFLCRMCRAYLKSGKNPLTLRLTGLMMLKCFLLISLGL